ncbi:hypothetical protein L227DRAFT_395263 [Lentinus tigrinus ALCF2SS1-6]|uniref:Uncharacterized protein n=1 Tax=Lentinus tigrinus ALCF2SS1-6 TaxID=1328759 RepID=A0A5C2RSU4_9APHY|nr:hypothetical protein L227DRAFT_395263 [Lentinus tigrinus ALCF2SS1-6]
MTIMPPYPCITSWTLRTLSGTITVARPARLTPTNQNCPSVAYWRQGPSSSAYQFVRFPSLLRIFAAFPGCPLSCRMPRSVFALPRPAATTSHTPVLASASPLPSL